MLTQLRAIFDLIIQFQSTQESMYNAALEELKARQRLDDLAKQRTDKVTKHLLIFQMGCCQIVIFGQIQQNLQSSHINYC